MSGPKSSRYTLTPEQRKALEEQRQRERRRAVARESINQASKKLLAIGSRLPEAEKIAAALKSDRGFGEKCKEMEGYIASVTAAVAATGGDDLDGLEATADAVAKTLSKAEQLADQLFRIAAENEAELKASLSENIDRGVSTSFADAAPRVQRSSVTA